MESTLATRVIRARFARGFRAGTVHVCATYPRPMELRACGVWLGWHCWVGAPGYMGVLS